MGARIILCSNCGTKNRLPQQFDSQPKCGKCGKLLAVNRYKGGSFGFGKVIAAALGLGFIVFVFNMPQKTTKHAFTTTTARSSSSLNFDDVPMEKDTNSSKNILPVDPDLKLVVVPISPGVINKPTTEGVAPLSFRTSPGSNYYVKLVDHNNHTEMTIYMRGGESFETLVPLGTYEIRYAAGDVWYGQAHLFGKSTAFSKISESFDFTFDG